MNTENTRVTREEAAEAAQVSLRQIRRWREAGRLTVEYDPSFRRPATYDLAEVMKLAERGVEDLPLPPA